MSIEDLKSTVQQACITHGVRRLDLFGSMARSGGQSGQDYDFVATLEAPSPSEYARKYFGLLHSLEDTLKAPVDLLTMRSITKRGLMARIEEEAVCLYES